MTSEARIPAREALGLSRSDGTDFILQALDHVRGGSSPHGGPHGAPPIARQESALREWAQSAGLLLTAEDLPQTVLRGGQEHDLFHDLATDRYIKVTRHGVFGLSPGIELDLVSSGQDGRRFHLWEATPLEYLVRLALHNVLVPGLNCLEGVLSQVDGDLAIVTSQPRFDKVPVTQSEIDGWFASQGFRRVTSCGYYREEDNLGVFDAHDRNVLRAVDTLVPFDVIPCQPSGGFLQFIADTLSAGHFVEAVRTVTTAPRSS